MVPSRCPLDYTGRDLDLDPSRCPLDYAGRDLDPAADAPSGPDHRR